MTDLFSSFQLKDVTLKNRIAIPPMCQYMADDGLVNDWHKVHYASLARGGSGLVIVEATAVAPEGRITPRCLGLWNDDKLISCAKLPRQSKLQVPFQVFRLHMLGVRQVPISHGKAMTIYR